MVGACSAGLSEADGFLSFMLVKLFVCLLCAYSAWLVRAVASMFAMYAACVQTSLFGAVV